MKWAFFILVLILVCSRISLRSIRATTYVTKPVTKTLVGRIVQIKKITPLYMSFIFKAHGKRLYLHWYHLKRELHSGEAWRLTCRLRPPTGLHNAVGFNYQHWLLSQNIVATGYVFSGKLIAPAHLNWLQTFRERINEFISTHIDEHAGLLMALTTGNRKLMTKDDWHVLQSTGTSHLFAISGLHLAVIALLFIFVVGLVWKCYPNISLYFSTNRAALLFSSLMMIPYAFFVGFSIPVQRALFMLTLFMGFSLFSRRIEFWHKYFLVALLVIFIQPGSIYSASFYLSFGAVYIIGLLAKGDLVVVSKWRQWLRMQLGMFFGLFALNLWFFAKTSMISPLANIIAIPWMTLLIVPCCLLASISFLFSKTVSLLFFKVAVFLLSLLWKYLQCLSL